MTVGNKKTRQGSTKKPVQTKVIKENIVSELPHSEEQETCKPDPELFTRHEAGKLFLWFFLGLLFFSLYLVFSIMQPFLHSIILGCVFTAICYPFYMWCLKKVGGREVFASLIVVFFVTFLVVVPICLFVAGLIPQAKQSIATVSHYLSGTDLGDTLTARVEPILSVLHEYFPELELESLDIRGNIANLVRNAGQFVIGSISSVVGNTVIFIIHLLLILLIMFFLLMDGAKLVGQLQYMLPLKPQQTSVVIESLRRMSRAVLVGGFFVATIQGIVGGIGFAIVGIPAFFWGTVMIFAALVPVVGTGLVWVPAVIVLLLTDQWKSALFLIAWCGVGVSSIDSFLRPWIMRGGAKVPVLFIFLSILGGINVFGMLGLLYGPMILGFVAVMLDIYKEEYSTILQRRRPKQEELE